MIDAVICEPLRTPVGRFGGVLRDVAPETLAATLITEICSRTGIGVALAASATVGRCRLVASE